MSARKLTNISIASYREFLRKTGCEYLRTSSGHEIWSRKDLTRPITFQTHIDPVPEFIIKNALRSLSISKEDFWNILEGK